MDSYIESLNIVNNTFVLEEDTTIEFLIHFAAPFTGTDSITVPKGTCFALYGPTRDDAFYMSLVEDDSSLLKRMEIQVQNKYPKISNRFAGFSFFITEEQLNTLPLFFKTGSRDRALEILQLIIKRNEEGHG